MNSEHSEQLLEYLGYIVDALREIDASLKIVAARAENPMIRAEFVDELSSSRLQTPEQHALKYPPCVKCGGIDHVVTFLPVGYSPSYDQKFGVGAPLANELDFNDRTTHEWLLNHCRGCRRDWLTLPLDSAK